MDAAVWTAPPDVADLLAATEDALAPYQPSQRYFLLDEARTRPADLPPGNLVSALVALETTRDRQKVVRHLRRLIGLLAGQEDDELRRAFSAWARQALMPATFRPNETEPLAHLEEVHSMLAETVREWTKDWVAQGMSKASRRAARKGEPRNAACSAGRRPASSTPAPPGSLADALAGVDDPARLAQVGEWIIECTAPTTCRPSSPPPGGAPDVRPRGRARGRRALYQPA